MNILNFIQDFPNEESCIDHFRLNREQHVIVCKKCSGQKHYWLKAKTQWQCAQCNFRTTIRSGTVMQGSNLPIRKWYLAMAFMTATKKGISAKELQRQLHHKRYDTIWSLMHRIRNAMGNKEDSMTMNGIMKFNENYLLKAQPDGRKLKRGKPTTEKKYFKRPSTFLDKEPKVHTLSSYWKMEVKDVVLRKKKGKKIDFDEMQISIAKRGRSLDLSKHVYAFPLNPGGHKEPGSKEYWEKIMIVNAKKVILGIYHKIKGKYLQLYLNEFCFKLNRRHISDQMFQKTTMAVAQSFWHDCGES